MDPSDIWGATDVKWALPEPEVTVDGIDCSHMTPEEAFKAGIDAGKRAIIKEFDEYFIEPQAGGRMTTPQILQTLECSARELDAIVVDDIDFFHMDRLPKIYQAFKRNTSERR